MGRVIAVLERYHREVALQAAPHRLCGTPTLSVGTIAGGLSVNTVPAECVIEIDRRLIPGEDAQTVHRQIVDYVTRETDGDPNVVHDSPFLVGLGLSDHDNGPLAEKIVAGAHRANLDCRAIGVPFGTNAAAFSAVGVPSVVFGPGSIDQAHTADEWLALEQLAAASEALYQFGREY
jgi:acetylornithine deacetylase/succinyl-diaminopimelate desuccinylase-like protein